MPWYATAVAGPDPLDQPWRFTCEELRNSLLFHGTSEPIKGEIGSGIEELWVAFDPATAQNYIPQSGSRILLSLPWGSHDDDHVPPDFALATVVRQMGYKPVIHKADHTGRPTEWSYEGTWPTYKDVKRWIEQDMGYKRGENGGYWLKVVFRDGKDVIQPADYKMPGELHMLSGRDKLNIFDMAEGREGDLMEPDYNKYDLFEMLKKKGYDGVKINDFGQSEYWGNYGHSSMILFPSGLAKLKKRKIDARNFDWSEETGWKFDTDEFRQWHLGEVRKALAEGKDVPKKVLDEHPELAQKTAGKVAVAGKADREYPVAAVIRASGRYFEGRTHGEALQQAENMGYVTRDENDDFVDKDGKNLNYDGSIDLFRTNKGRIIDRWQASRLGEATSSEDIPEVEADTLEKILGRHQAKGLNVSVYDDGESLSLSTLNVPRGQRKQGLGTAFMEDLCAYADRVGKRIELNLGDKSAGETTSKSRLVEFYRRFGFVRNFGRTVDYRLSCQMYRLPVKGRLGAK